MLRAVPLVWMPTLSPKMFTREKLFGFLRSGLWRKRIIVLQAGEIAPDMQRWLDLARRFGVLRIVQLTLETQHYTERDFALVGEARARARLVLKEVLQEVLEASENKMSAQEVEDIARGLEIQLGDRIYTRVRMLLQVLHAAGLDPAQPWEEYDRWFNDKLEHGQKSDPSKAHKRPLVYNITSAQAMPTMLTDALPGFDIAPDVRPATLVLSVNSRDAYLASARSILQAEARLERPALALFQVARSNQIEALQQMSTRAAPLMIYDWESRDFAPWKYIFKGTRQTPKPTDHLYASFDPSMEIAAPIAGLHRETCLRLIANEVVISLNGYLPRVLAFYVRIMHSPQFDRVDTLVCAPSRMAAYVPVFEGMKRRGVQNVEYQALFWSGHPRYEVRDMDLFVCSDRATLKVIEKKYQGTDWQGKLVLGPAFPMSEFQKTYAALATAAEASTEEDLVGLALQPGYDDAFLRACDIIRAQGKRILIRPHPSQPLAEVEAKYAHLGEIDQASLEAFMHRSAVIVTGFSNVAFQAAIIGKPSICLPIRNQLGIDLSDASESIHICTDFDDLARLVSRDLPVDPSAVLTDPIAQWCDLRRAFGLPDHANA